MCIGALVCACVVTCIDHHFFTCQVLVANSLRWTWYTVLDLHRGPTRESLPESLRSRETFTKDITERPSQRTSQGDLYKEQHKKTFTKDTPQKYIRRSHTTKRSPQRSRQKKRPSQRTYHTKTSTKDPPLKDRRRGHITELPQKTYYRKIPRKGIPQKVLRKRRATGSLRSTESPHTMERPLQTWPKISRSLRWV